jgi:hypothetical protein
MRRTAPDGIVIVVQCNARVLPSSTVVMKPSDPLGPVTVPVPVSNVVGPTGKVHGAVPRLAGQ